MYQLQQTAALKGALSARAQDDRLEHPQPDFEDSKDAYDDDDADIRMDICCRGAKLELRSGGASNIFTGIYIFF